jgi:ABC-type sulfate transport system substrate-binding protein
VALLAGFAGLMVSTLPLGAWAWKQIPDWQARRRQLSRKKFQTQCRVSLDQLERRLTSDDVEIKEQYQSLEELVRGYLQYFFSLQTQGLTHAELTSRMNQDELASKETGVFAQVFEHSQNCRYAPENGTNWEDSFRQDVKQVKQFCI